MTRTTIPAVAGAMLLSLTADLSRLPEPAATVVPAASVNPDRAAAEQRFALRFCFNQYRSQQDATACLARYVR